nr:gynecophoral canal protein [Hymenolepis microstoma]
MAPELPQKYNQKKYGPLFKGINMCAYKTVRTDIGTISNAWICGPVDEKDTKVIYDCCPGYKRTPLVNDECVEKNPTYMSIISTLQDMKRDETADVLQQQEPELDKNGKDFTVFVPEEDYSIQYIKENDASNLIVPGRYYSGYFKSGTDILTKTGYPFKISTYNSGLVFVECQPLTKPDFETSNGIIHFTSGAISASNSYGSVMDRLRSDPDLSDFTASIPSDLRSQLSATNSKERYTVFAPTNSAWSAAKREVGDPQGVADLVKQHVQDSLVCGQSIDEYNRLLGPSRANTYIRASQQADGTRILVDSCGRRTNFVKMDMMAGNGVVHKLSNVLQNPGSMNLRDALNCLANGPDKELNQAAREMAGCGISVQLSDNAVVLLPTSEALAKSSVRGCTLYQNHVLTSTDCKMKNVYGIGTPQECHYTSQYTASGGRRPTFTNQYIRTREGSTLHFGKAETIGLKPIAFRGGVIFSVKSTNPPPTKTLMEIIREDSVLSTTYEKMQMAGYFDIINQNSPNVIFFAPLNHGWKNRYKENAYSSSQLRNLFEMQTIPHQLITGEYGNIESETIQEMQSLSGVKLKIKRTLDGNTFIGYDGMSFDHWALAIGDPIIAIDGVVQVVDWPLICNRC